MLRFEQSYWDSGFERVAGVDEAGRGPLAGPVVAAACLIPQGVFFEEVNDSKCLTAIKREELFELITRHPLVSFSIAVIEADEIDRINILQATLRAMHIAADALPQSPDVILVDGNKTPTWKYRSQFIIGGDGLSHCIAAASILAKVTRDRRMHAEEANYPGYGFAKHKGYGTKEHLEAIEKLGPCLLHRHSFEPLKSGRTIKL